VGKLLPVIIIAAMVATFAMDNMHRVELGLIVGRPYHVRLFFLLMTSFLLGCFSTMLINMYARTKSREKGQAAQDAEDDEFFSD
jgi:uncharacterized integral membrane protein